MPVLSVVIPAYNEERNIEGVLQDVIRDVAAVVPDIEIIVVDDGSRDRTAELAGKAAAQDGRIRVISQANQGHGPALSNGLDAAKGDWLLLLDGDRQVSLEDFARHWGMAQNLDAILGLRRPRSDPFHRLLVSRAMRLLLRRRLGADVGDAGAPYKLVRAAIWQQARKRMRDGCWIPSVLLAAYIHQHAELRSVELPIRHRARPHGPSTLNLQRLIKFCRQGAAEIEFYRNRSNQPS